MKNTYTKEFMFEQGKTMEVYNSTDQLIELNDYDIDGNLTTKVIYKYDDKGNNVSRLVLDKNGKQIRLLKFEYNAKGEIVSDQEFDAENQLVYSKTYERNRNDKKIKVRIFDKNGKLAEEKLEDFV